MCLGGTGRFDCFCVPCKEQGKTGQPRRQARARSRTGPGQSCPKGGQGRNAADRPGSRSWDGALCFEHQAGLMMNLAVLPARRGVIHRCQSQRPWRRPMRRSGNRGGLGAGPTQKKPSHAGKSPGWGSYAPPHFRGLDGCPKGDEGQPGQSRCSASGAAGELDGPAGLTRHEG